MRKRSRIQWIGADGRPSPLTSAITRYFSIGPELGACMRSASPFRARLPSPAQGWVCRIRVVFPSLRERFGRWHLYRARGSKPTYSTKPTLRAGCRDLQVPGATPATPPRQKGSFLAESPCGGRERSIAPPSGQETRFAGFAVRTWLCGPAGRKPSHCGPVRDGGNAEGANLGAYRVCRFAPDRTKTARDENSMLARVCSRFVGWIAEIGPRAFAHRLTHRTQVVITFREARTRARV